MGCWHPHPLRLHHVWTFLIVEQKAVACCQVLCCVSKICHGHEGESLDIRGFPLNTQLTLRREESSFKGREKSIGIVIAKIARYICGIIIQVMIVAKY